MANASPTEEEFNWSTGYCLEITHIGPKVYTIIHLYIPTTVHNKIKKLAYQFIWDGRKMNTLEQNDLSQGPRVRGGLGVRDLDSIDISMPIKNSA